jgi:hypothetical protein
VLITSAAFAVTLSAYRRRDRMAWAYALTTVANIVERPDGLKIAGCFIGAILIVSLVSRVIRAYELRAPPSSRPTWRSGARSGSATRY